MFLTCSAEKDVLLVIVGSEFLQDRETAELFQPLQNMCKLYGVPASCAHFVENSRMRLQLDLPGMLEPYTFLR